MAKAAAETLDVGEPDEIARLVAAIFADDRVLNRRELAKRADSSYQTVRWAIDTGVLNEIKVSPRRCVITPSAYERYLRLMNEQEVDRAAVAT